jgi:hypothetical protein
MSLPKRTLTLHPFFQEKAVFALDFSRVACEKVLKGGKKWYKVH